MAVGAAVVLLLALATWAFWPTAKDPVVTPTAPVEPVKVVVAPAAPPW